MNFDEILLLGGNGQLGCSFIELANAKSKRFLHYPATGKYYLGNDSLSTLIASTLPRVIINAAAYTNVESAEKEPEKAFFVNFDSVAHLAGLAKRYNALLVHFSSDYVFDGSGIRPWHESDQPSPLNIYGQSKWLGEQAIITSGCRYLIIRTSWLHSPWRNNFIKTMLQLGHTKTELVVVCDQVGAPTSTVMLADMVLLAIEQVLTNPLLAGVYHIAATGGVSWFDYARFIFSEAKDLGLVDRVPNLISVTSDNYLSQVSRPLNSRLDTTKFCHAYGVQLPDWRKGVLETLNRL
ncbi:dTDP-4-dehydrorhamnose reductase [Aeromonas salmonicida]|uniref:dTDP-4-dehydrorhamnose reductase n=1 Tax=Aeromonas salmonicida TaxID=645 RepID=UPI000B613051|nr:dTDP-4-dehydrorhamnose reductase [Aeromonas salmonicida]ARW81417.1 dTDP-4-dehydrorhamnose reductase [Aeromonas salmonicida]